MMQRTTRRLSSLVFCCAMTLAMLLLLATTMLETSSPSVPSLSSSFHHKQAANHNPALLVGVLHEDRETGAAVDVVVAAAVASTVPSADEITMMLDNFDESFDDNDDVFDFVMMEPEPVLFVISFADGSIYFCGRNNGCVVIEMAIAPIDTWTSWFGVAARKFYIPPSLLLAHKKETDFWDSVFMSAIMPFLFLLSAVYVILEGKTNAFGSPAAGTGGGGTTRIAPFQPQSRQDRSNNISLHSITARQGSNKGSTTSAPTSAFGSQPTALGGGLFGAPPAPAPVGGGLFGATSNTGVFGASTPVLTTGSTTSAPTSAFGSQPTALGGGLFGAPPAPAPVGGGLLGATSNTGAFGASIPVPTTGSATSAPTSAFGSQPTALGGGLFGAPPAPAPVGGGLLGATSNTSAFGASIPVPTTGGEERRVWECDIGEDWVQYPSYVSELIEKQVLSGGGRVTFVLHDTGNEYEIDLSAAPIVQFNTKTRFKRNVRSMVKQHATLPNGVPATWLPHDADENCKMVSLCNLSKEWDYVEKILLSDLPNAKLVKVERVQNITLWNFFRFRREKVRKLSGETDTKSVWHGTRDTDPMCICNDENDGFMTQQSRQGLWGWGIYFAAKASYSNQYAYMGRQKPPSTLSHQKKQTKSLILANLVVGDAVFLKPDLTLRCCPQKKNGRGRYDTVTGVSGSKIYVVYENGRAYPEYLVTYM